MFHVKRFTSKTQKAGLIGEQIAEMFLVKHGYTILDRNSTKRWGEIDIIAKKSGVIHFVEVKLLKKRVSRETGPTNPFENITFQKMEKIKRTVVSWVAEHRVSRETRFQIDGIAVNYDGETKSALVKLLENINI
jgi:putative endonuclease